MLPPRFSLQQARTEIQQMVGHNAKSSELYKHLRTTMMPLSSVSPNQQTELLAAAEKILTSEVLPGFDRLDDYLVVLRDQASDELSVYQFEGGDAYYQYLLNHFNTAEIPVQEVHDLGLVQLARIQVEMQASFAALGYPEDISIPDGYQRVATESGTLNGQALANRYQQVLDHADANLDAYFDLRPQAKLEVVGGNVGAFYSPGALDGSRPGRFYARTNTTESIFKIATVAYHEGIPGHHYQIALAQESDLPLFRNVFIFDAYTEGWALYAEYLPAEMGWYDDDAYGDLGRLQYEALRACRMILDTGIHAYGWSFDEAVDFMIANTGISQGFAGWEVARYIAYPGQAPSYMVGQLEILRLRSLAETAFGEAFDIRQFHNIVL